MNTSIKYEDIYSDDTVKQKEVTEVFSTCLRIREKLIRNLSSPEHFKGGWRLVSTVHICIVYVVS